MTVVVPLLYIVAFGLFILGLSGLTGPRTAVHGNKVAAVGMVVAVVATLLTVRHNWLLILVGLVIGGALGVPSARRVRMTAMPQMVALFNGVGGGAAALISLAEFHNIAPAPGRLHGDISVSIILSALIGSISFAGSMVAFAKLQELIQGRPIIYPGQQVVNGLLFAGVLAAGAAIVATVKSRSRIVGRMPGREVRIPRPPSRSIPGDPCDALPSSSPPLPPPSQPV